MVKVIKHNQLDKATLALIIAIKNISWCYSDEEHLEWMNNNLKGDDYHFLIYQGSDLIAYMNLVNVTIESQNSLYPVLGIGNVCTKYKGRGDGKLLMEEVNSFLLENDKKGLLFCKDHLINFYLKHNWQLIKKTHSSSEINTMVFNLDASVSDFQYNDRLF